MKEIINENIEIWTNMILAVGTEIVDPQMAILKLGENGAEIKSDVET